MDKILAISILFIFSLVASTRTSGIPSLFATSEEETEESEESEETEDAEEAEETEEVETEKTEAAEEVENNAGASPTPTPIIDPTEGDNSTINPGDVAPTYSIDPGDVEPSDGTRTGQGAPTSNPCMIAMDLSRLTPLEIRSYPTNQFSSSDLESIFACLDSVDLAKVLINIPLGDLRSIQATLTPLPFEQVLNRLNVADKIEVQNRLSS